jgi:hypothetical protein
LWCLQVAGSNCHSGSRHQRRSELLSPASAQAFSCFVVPRCNRGMRNYHENTVSRACHCERSDAISGWRRVTRLCCSGPARRFRSPLRAAIGMTRWMQYDFHPWWCPDAIGAWMIPAEAGIHPRRSARFSGFPSARERHQKSHGLVYPGTRLPKAPLSRQR